MQQRRNLFHRFPVQPSATDYFCADHAGTCFIYTWAEWAVDPHDVRDFFPLCDCVNIINIKFHFAGGFPGFN